MKKGKNNPYQNIKVKTNIKRTHLPMYMWTKKRFLKEIKIINPKIDCNELVLGALKYKMLEYKGQYQYDTYRTIYFWGLKKEYISKLTQNDVDKMVMFK